MSRLACLSLCLALAVLAGGASAQVLSDTISFDMFLLNKTSIDMDHLLDNRSQAYADLVIKINEYFSPIGGWSESILVSDGGGCVKVNVVWRNGNQTHLAELMEALKEDGILDWEQTLTVSLTSCTETTTLLRFTFYVVGMPWSDSFTDHTSMEYQQLWQIVALSFNNLGGKIRALEVAQNDGCVEFYVEWDALNSTSIIDLTSSLKTEGLTLYSQHFMVDTKPCAASPAETTLLRFKFYVANMPWSENLKNHNSYEYLDVMQNVEDAFFELQGDIRALEITQNSGCVEFYVELETLDSTSILDLMSVLTTQGILINNQKYTILTKPCAAETTLLRFKFYVVNMTWSDSLRDHNNMEYLQLRQIVEDTFSNLGGSIRALEIAKNYGCLEFYLEWDALDLVTIMDYISVLKKDGIAIMNQTYAVQTKPCEIPTTEVDECPEIPGGTFGACVMACDDSDAARKCSDGFKCCSNGCGRTCIRVGYTLKMNTTIVIDMNVMGNVDDQSAIFSQLQMATKTVVQRSFNVEKPSLIADVELVKISSYSVQNQPLSLLDVVLYLREDGPNMDLNPGKIRLMKDNYNIENGSFRVIDVRLGSNSASVVSMCDGIKCNGICKELRSDVQYCSCDPGYVGPDCATFDCRAETSLTSGTNNSLCENGGECVRKLEGQDFECQCQPGHYGPLCQVDLNSCPLLPARRPGLIGLCQSTCIDGDCGEDKMCCQIACGGNACVEVGYYQKMLASITLNFPFDDAFRDSNSFQYQIFREQLETWINSLLKEKSLLGFKLATIVGFNSSTDGQMARRKRDLSNTIIQLEIRFTDEIPVQDMFAIRDSILADGFNDGQNTWLVLNISYGNEGGCPYMTCATGSFCVTNFGGGLQCACPKLTSGQLCDVTEAKLPCDLGLCLNGGICHNMPNGQQYCDCPQGFSGSVCENAANHCPTGEPLMTTSGERHCFRQPCPMGFMCNVDPLDRWTACCFKEDFLCELNPCKAGGRCNSNFNSGTICDCPKGSKGLFCEEASNDTAVPTDCQRKQLFNDWVINILKTGIPSQGITLEDMRVILQHMGYQYFPTDICDEQGNFKSVAQGVLVVNPTADRIKICMDKYGNYDRDCGGAICDVLSNNGSMEFCMNGGICVGEITQQLCDCSGTGYHGIQCELSNADGVSETNCTVRRDIAYLAIGILNGSVSLMPGFNTEIIQEKVKEILLLYNSNNIFVPYCDEEGQYEYRGCIYMADDVSKKTCYCALDDGTSFGNEESPFEPPPNCQTDSCPKEWGEDCERPDWWCLESMQCQPDTERCAYYTRCTDDMCTLEAAVGCVAKDIVLPCDLHPCKDDPFSMCQPCGTHGSCYNVGSVNKTADMGYRCQCKMGFSGLQCEINENICSHIPKGFCESRCIGDVSNGQLCQCDPGYGGIFCDKPARSLCERRKAFYDDVFSILSGEISARNGFSVAEMKSALASIIEIEGGDAVPVVDCTEKGFYAKVQCMVSVNNLNDMNCYCVDFNNNPISSNVKPYIGFDVCTAPTDPRELAPTACNVPEYFDVGELTVCQNGGTCIFDIYAGKFCECPEGYHGQFCQYQRNVPADSDEPRSLCEFFVFAWDTAHEISIGSADWITNDMQKNLYLNLSLNFLQLKMNQSFALKAECQDDGTFKPAACYHNIMTDEIESCYCWNLRGPNVEGLPVESADSDECSGIKDTTCPKMKCLYICEHGYRKDNTGCRTCECKNPCEDITCDFGQRCVIEERMDCDKDDRQMTCTKAVCMSADKLGVCPGYSGELYSSVPGGLLAIVKNSSSCNMMCFDDTDCEGQKKCCGLCGSMCVDPEEPVAHSCQDNNMKMNTQLEFINMARDELRTTRTLSPADIRTLERITDIQQYWIPECDGDLYNPLQCQRYLDISGALGNISSCFCVDLFGEKIDGAKANSSDQTSCDIKPFTCPFVEPSHSSIEPNMCSSDLDCFGSEKCCDEICLSPVDTSKLTTTFDQLMSTLCEKNSHMCQGGSQCVTTWVSEGIACECPSDRVGPFCEQLVSDITEIPNTPCERKNFALKVFTAQLQETNSSLSFLKLLDSILDDDMEIDVTAIWYNCTADGAYEPKQCVVNAYNAADGKSQTQCFCVYEDGMEILGTRMSVKDGQAVFCGENHMTCPVGNAYREDSGELLECESRNNCPMEYTCSRSTYGKLYCCPTKEGFQDVCAQPKDVGMVCPSDSTGKQSGTYYYYDSDVDSCVNFTYNGCEGNRNRFSTMEQCKDRCQQNTVPGTCPMDPVKVTARVQCPDLCSEDDNCDENYKCCSSTCGKRCIPAGEVIIGNICPIGQPREAMDGGMCNRTRPCEMGYMCEMIEQNGNYIGVCCPDYRIDQCLIPPSTQHCQDYEERYFYNATSKMCEIFSYGGCDPDFNNFKSLEDCCATCNGEGRCKLGQCPVVKPGTVATCMSECFVDGDCSGKMICCSNGCGTTCVVPEVEQTSDCLSQQMEAVRSKRMRKAETSDNDCDVMSIPVCEKDGTWAREQCQTSLGICWCVSPQGHYINNTITRGVPPCQSVSQSMIMRADQSQIDISQMTFSVCNNGKDVHCCSNALCTQKCWAYPTAVCRINPCGGCKAEYYSIDGRMVDCDEGLTSCEQELKLATTAVQEHQINAALARGEDIDDVYNSISCKNSKECSGPKSLRTNYPGRCQLPPETGPCKGFQRQWYFDPASGKCDMFIWGMCEGNDNRFNSPEECYNFCSPSSNPCLNINCNVTDTICKLQYDENCYTPEMICNVSGVCTDKDPGAYLVGDIFVPKCQATGEYNYKQCYGSYCWCVNSKGQYVNGLTVEQSSTLVCTESGTSQDISPTDGVCPNGAQPNIACVKACTKAICPGQPEAICEVDLCSSDCSTRFVDKSGQEVKCTGDVCDVFTFEESKECTDNVPCPGTSVKTCPMFICEQAMKQNCSTNPCAICMVDPCTCQPYFVHAITHSMLTVAECNYLSLGVCELKACNILSDIAKAKYNQIDMTPADAILPECDDKGIFKPQQCMGSTCHCVDQFGMTTEAGADGSCKAIDKIKRMKVTFTFRADYNTFKSNQKLQILVVMLLNKLMEAGIDPRIIINTGEPYEGSIKVDVTFEDTADSFNKDLALIQNVLEQMAKMGALDLIIDGQPVTLINITEEVKTESQVAQENEETHTNESTDPLDRDEKIIIGVVCGFVGLLIIGIICYCLCCRKKQKKEALDDSFEHVRESKKPTSQGLMPMYNQVYEDESNTVKVRL